MTERPTYCCGTCPGIHGGGYDCTCLNNKNCPLSDTYAHANANFGKALKQLLMQAGGNMLHNMLWRANQWLTRLLYRNHKRRYRGLKGGQDD